MKARSSIEKPQNLKKLNWISFGETESTGETQEEHRSNLGKASDDPMLGSALKRKGPPIDPMLRQG